MPLQNDDINSTMYSPQNQKKDRRLSNTSNIKKMGQVSYRTLIISTKPK